MLHLAGFAHYANTKQINKRKEMERVMHLALLSLSVTLDGITAPLPSALPQKIRIRIASLGRKLMNV